MTVICSYYFCYSLFIYSAGTRVRQSVSLRVRAAQTLLSLSIAFFSLSFGFVRVPRARAKASGGDKKRECEEEGGG